MLKDDQSHKVAQQLIDIWLLQQEFSARMTRSKLLHCYMFCKTYYEIDIFKTCFTGYRYMYTRLPLALPVPLHLPHGCHFVVIMINLLFLFIVNLFSPANFTFSLWIRLGRPSEGYLWVLMELKMLPPYNALSAGNVSFQEHVSERRRVYY